MCCFRLKSVNKMALLNDVTVDEYGLCKISLSLWKSFIDCDIVEFIVFRSQRITFKQRRRSQRNTYKTPLELVFNEIWLKHGNQFSIKTKIPLNRRNTHRCSYEWRDETFLRNVFLNGINANIWNRIMAQQYVVDMSCWRFTFSKNCGMRNQAAATINPNDFGCESVEEKNNRNTNRNEKKCEKFIEFFAVNLWTVIWVELRWSSQIWELNVFVTYVGNLVFSSVGSMSSMSSMGACCIRHFVCVFDETWVVERVICCKINSLVDSKRI